MQPIFKLSEKFLSIYQGKQPQWGFGDLSYFTYKRTYARLLPDGTQEEFYDTVKRVVEGVFNIQLEHCRKVGLPWDAFKAQKSAQKMFEKMWEFKFLPPGRGLQMMGTKAVELKLGACLNNCFSGDTKFISPMGSTSLREAAMADVHPYVLNKDGKFVGATVQFFGKQPLQTITFRPFGLRSNCRLVYEATPNHRWILEDGTETTTLKIGDKVSTIINTEDVVYPEFNLGKIHGVIFGDGTRHTYYPRRHMIRLCDTRTKELLGILEEHPGYVSTTTVEGDPFVTIISDINLKQLPEPHLHTVSYLKGFVSGWLTADSHSKLSVKHYESYCLDSINEEAIDWLVANASLVGYSVIGHHINNIPTNYGERTRPLHRLTITPSKIVYCVESITPLEGLHDVYCVVEPEGKAFVLSGGLLTGNCAFISTKDIKKGLGDPFGWAADMLMLGVGVGFDTKGAGTVEIKGHTEEGYTYTIPDTREGWVESIKLLINSFTGLSEVTFDYSLIRPAGSLIAGFGGTASGPDPLIEGHNSIRKLLTASIGQKITSVIITDIMNYIGKIVVSGNIRRSAELSLGDINDRAFFTMKDPKVHKKELLDRRWASNNTVTASPDSDFSKIMPYIVNNGEPGLFFLNNAQHYGRFKDGWYSDTHDKFDPGMGINPCSEQILDHRELCVAGSTYIHTKNGLNKISSLENEKVEIWNGSEWSMVQVIKTGHLPISRVHFSDGSFLDATPGHEWITKTRSEKTYKVRRTDELKVGMKLPEFELKNCEGSPVKHAYELGWIAGDGFVDATRSMAVVQESEYKIIEERGWPSRKEQHPPNYTRSFKRVNLSKFVSLQDTKQLRDHSADLPNIILQADADSLRDFFAGWIDTDGNINRNLYTDALGLYGDERKLRTAQILLRRIGINHSSIRLLQPAGTVTNYGTRNQDLWRLTIPSFESNLIPTRIKLCKKIGSRYRINNAYKGAELADRARKQVIIKIEKLDKEDTFCFTEPLRHMGVFGNVLTRQCTLCETFPANHNSAEEYLDTLKYAYLYAKTVTLVPTHDPEVNSVMMRNRRIGLSQSGIQQALKKFGHAEYFSNFCDKGYEKVKYWDKIYSRWLGIPTSIRVTSVKPSGTVSLLAGATPGVHCTHSEYYYRTVRVSANSSLIPKMEKAGYHIEIDTTAVEGQDIVWNTLSKSVKEDYINRGGLTLVIYFPVKEKNFTKSKFDISLWEQLSLVRELQYYWSDNSVSVTITFKDHEKKDLESAIKFFAPYVKTLSFLPLTNHKYKQAPYIEITEQEYNDYVAYLNPLDLSEESQTLVEEKYCNNDSCTI